MINSKKFREWITFNRKDNGDFYKDKYASNCETSINTLFAFINIKDFYGKANAYEIDNVAEFELFIANHLENNAKYKKDDKELKNYRYGNAVKFYLAYLKELETVNTIEDDEYISVVAASEGKRTLYYTTRYERDKKLRTQAIQIHSPVCCACGFDFEKKYGLLGKNYIEVHHIKPLYTLNEEIEVNPSTDLVCVCSNCHRMLHRKKGTVLSIKELKRVVRREYVGE